MRRASKAIADHLAIPPFLLRPRTEENKAIADEVVRQTFRSGTRTWIMPKHKIPEEIAMSSSKRKAEADSAQEIQTQDPGLPVKMQFHPERGVAIIKDFDNLEEFMEWFNPAIHAVVGSEADTALTMIEVREKPTPGGKKKLAAGDPALAGTNAVEGAIPPSPGKTRGRGAVIRPEGSSSGRGGARPGAVRHGCKVDGKGPFGSVYKAFLEMRLDVGKHTKFRADLKNAAGGKLAYEEGGKKYNFELVSGEK